VAKQRGFALTELLINIAIVVILADILFSAVTLIGSIAAYTPLKQLEFDFTCTGRIKAMPNANI
jgi:prepilin-type N-terminal cleavage/methylation domain-containing protein